MRHALLLPFSTFLLVVPTLVNSLPIYAPRSDELSFIGQSPVERQQLLAVAIGSTRAHCVDDPALCKERPNTEVTESVVDEELIKKEMKAAKNAKKAEKIKAIGFGMVTSSNGNGGGDSSKRVSLAGVRQRAEKATPEDDETLIEREISTRAAMKLGKVSRRRPKIDFDRYE